MADVYFDGDLLGTHDNPEELREKLIEQRREGKLDNEVNVSYDEDKDELRVVTDAGRVRRPLAVVEDGEPLLTEEHVERLNNRELTLEDLADEGVIEYLDAQEEENAYVAMDRDDVTEEHTHMELDPATTHGLSASSVVY
ncbi:MAG: DNA-directed RNA polymerase subunit B, partial [Candidatus Nanohaloarchaea archaeon]|nr:DNA-directed RNA polymerase subunit B [Candidatus Nanohaloarchaea archaeon]